MYRDESGACTAVPTGFVSVHTKSVFAPSDTNTVCQMVGPTGTRCSGWRQHGDNTFDSGDNGGIVYFFNIFFSFSSSEFSLL